MMIGVASPLEKGSHSVCAVADCYKSAFSWWNQPPDILSHECLSNLM